MAIHFNGSVPPVLKERRALKNYINTMIRAFDLTPGNLTISFCNDEEILQANRLYLSHNYYTDILTFDLSEPGNNLLNADILISVDTVQTNALKFKTLYSTEIHRVIFHGILHLCGYNDKSKPEITAMRKAEDHHLKVYLSI